MFVSLGQKDAPLFVSLGRKEDAEILGVLVDVEEDGARVFLGLTYAADERRVEEPLRDAARVWMWRHVPNPDRLNNTRRST